MTDKNRQQFDQEALNQRVFALMDALKEVGV